MQQISRVSEGEQPLILCGGGTAAEQFQKTVSGHTHLQLRSVTDVQSALRIYASKSCRAVVVTFDLAIEHLKPYDLRTWAAHRLPLFVLLPSVNVASERFEHLLRCGVSGFLTSDTTPDRLSLALKSVMKGELWLSRKYQSSLIRKSLFQLDRQFTPRERQILDCIAAGETNCDIARRLFITRETVRWHLRCVYGKLGVHSRKALTEVLRSAGGALPDDAETLQRVPSR